MADDMKRASDTMADAAKTTTDRLRDGAETARDAMKESGQKMVEGGSTIGVKMIDQAETNAREAFNAMREAARAKDLSEVMKIQGDYLRDQGQRSITQAREIGDLIMQFGRDAVAPLRSK